MKKQLIVVALLALVSTVGFVPAHLVAAEAPAAKSVIETIQLNQATAEELQALPGIGPALSERIVIYRTENGPFRSIEHLAEVKGIGQAQLAKFREYLSLN